MVPPVLRHVKSSHPLDPSHTSTIGGADVSCLAVCFSAPVRLTASGRSKRSKTSCHSSVMQTAGPRQQSGSRAPQTINQRRSAFAGGSDPSRIPVFC